MPDSTLRTSADGPDARIAFPRPVQVAGTRPPTAVGTRGERGPLTLSR